MRILIAAGGTGGHIFPALAAADSLREQVPDAAIRWVGGHRGLESSVVPSAGFELDRLWLRSLRTVDLSANTFLDPARLAASMPQALALLGRWRPSVVLTTGGYVAIPVLSAAAALRVPSALWEGNRIPGRSVRATARLATLVATSFAGTCRALPGPCFVTGTPIRELSTGGARAAARARFGLPDDVPCLLVFGGSQAVRRFNAAVREALPRLVEARAVIHICGESGYSEALRRREALPEELRSRYRPVPFLREGMADAYRSADMVVGRAGSSTLAEACAAGLPLVVVPYPHAGAHQTANARELVEAGAAVLVADEDFDGAALLRASALLDDPDRLATMRAASAASGRPGAAGALAELVLALAERRPVPDPSRIDALARGAA